MWRDVTSELPLNGEEVLVLLKSMRMIVRATLRFDKEAYVPYWQAKSWGKYYTKEVTAWMELPLEDDEEEYF